MIILDLLIFILTRQMQISRNYEPLPKMF